MDTTKEKPLILGRPFLSTARAHIDVGTREIRFNINGAEEKFNFRPKPKQCSMIRVTYGPNPKGIQEIEVTQQKKDDLITYVKALTEKDLKLEKGQVLRG